MKIGDRVRALDAGRIINGPYHDYKARKMEQGEEGTIIEFGDPSAVLVKLDDGTIIPRGTRYLKVIPNTSPEIY